jgi:hypothetical protein
VCNCGLVSRASVSENCSLIVLPFVHCSPIHFVCPATWLIHRQPLIPLDLKFSITRGLCNSETLPQGTCNMGQRWDEIDGVLLVPCIFLDELMNFYSHARNCALCHHSFRIVKGAIICHHYTGINTSFIGYMSELLVCTKSCGAVVVLFFFENMVVLVLLKVFNFWLIVQNLNL